jgi:hypothetical protein
MTRDCSSRAVVALWSGALPELDPVAALAGW